MGRLSLKNGTKVPAKDNLQTPPYGVEPVIPFLKPDWVVWEPAAGEGVMAATLRDHGFHVIATDIQTEQNFFTFTPEFFDVIVTNPPFSLKFDWLKRCFELNKPFALLLPTEFLGTSKGLTLIDGTGVEIIFIHPRIDFKTPNNGWGGSGAWFPTTWITWGLGIGSQYIIRKLNKRKYDAGDLR